MLPSPNNEAPRSPIRLRRIGLVAVQCIMLWLIPKTGDDFPQPISAYENLTFAWCGRSSGIFLPQTFQCCLDARYLAASSKAGPI